MNRFVPPSASGTPRKPATTEKNARTTSGTVIVAGDSWTCSSAPFGPRKVPKKVIRARRNM